MLPKKLAFVDIETTGTRYQYDRVIEIGIIRVEDNKIVQQYNQLLNPQCHLPPEITLLTGITAKDLENKPTFQEIKNTIFELLDECIFVAHNARFDYSFLKYEFAREEIKFAPKQCCTVKLSRYLFPTHSHHNLDAVMQRLNLVCKNRHRAYEDAHLLYQFYNKVQTMFSLETLEKALGAAMKKPSLPMKLKHEDLEVLPEEPGVYIFYSANDIPLYVGKSKNIKERVLSHFSADIRNNKEMKISQQIERIETIVTAGELGALFLEAKLVKKLLPLYNHQLRKQNELIALMSQTDKNNYPTILMQTITTIDPNELENFVGFFRSKRQAKDYLARMVKEYSLCDKLLGIEKTNSSCFSYRLDICKGACIGKEPAIKYNMRFLQAFSEIKVKPWPFKGPIIIEEYNPLNKKKEHFIIDKWCYIGSIKYTEDATNEQLSQDISFDLDIYKILRGFFRNPNNIKQVKTIKNTSLWTSNLSAS
ncbi:MAG TPA: exonuclease domain-containing protein [Patescibacteria group bacterium]|nr:exonuclease domain-containing protein [Patescibacteria group bacterium]